jgi:hypothetical protein
MKKTDFYRDIKINARYFIGVPLKAWYKDGAALALRTAKGVTVVSIKRNVVTLYHGGAGSKGETYTTDYNTGYKSNMVALTIDQLAKLI